ncbi:MAG TPA: response regulator [Longimicrobiales bacterium]|nr:response regulator [Longimicrobiales bacterium]
MSEPATYGRVPLKALILSAAALAVPMGVTLLQADLGPQQPLLWLLALVPAFLLAYYRGWQGAAISIAAGMAALATTHALLLGLGRALPDTTVAFAIVPVFIAIAFGIGWTTELLHRQLALAQESTNAVTLVVSQSGVVSYASPSVGHVLGFPRASVEGRPLADHVEPGSGARWQGPLDLRDGEVMELRLVDGRGVSRVLDVLVQDRRRVAGLGGFVLRGRDITDRHNAKDQAQRAERMQALSTLAGALAHDFNNALTAIQGNADLLREELSSDSPAQPGLRVIEDAVERSARTVEMLLAFTRQQVLRPRSLALGALLEETQPRLADLLGTRHEVILRAAEDLPPIFFDAVRLRRILLLLAQRAREVLPEHGGHFVMEAAPGEISAEKAATFPYPVVPGDYVVLTVRDSGRPLSDTQLAAVFEPFGVSIGRNSTGLELSSVYGTIKQGGGYVWVESNAAGTAFSIYLPVATIPLPLLVEPSVEERPRRTILVAEDDPSVRAVVREALLRRGYYVLEADDGEEALRVIEARGTPPDALVTDLMMPRLGGRDLARELLRRYGQFPILYISGYSEDAVMSESMLTPGETLLSKPFSARHVADALHDVLEGVTHT